MSDYFFGLFLHSLIYHGLVVQLVRIHACHAWGREFESRPDRKKLRKIGAFLFMEHFVYIIHSKKMNVFYKGYSTDPYRRLKQHNEGKTYYTKQGTPWRLVYIEKCNKKKEALIRGKKLKHTNKKYLLWLISSDKNILNQH